MKGTKIDFKMLHGAEIFVYSTLSLEGASIQFTWPIDSNITE
tara:strand:+ start:96 stop:221 length:126 start_codon:yes stop_codon:yes gene_type:complete